MQEILTLLYSRGDALPAKTIPNWERAPWLEQIHFRGALRDTAAHRLITSHLPARVLAPLLQRSKAKVRGAGRAGGPRAAGASPGWGSCQGLSEGAAEQRGQSLETPSLPQR